jgi:hypothetical protein
LARRSFIYWKDESQGRYLSRFSEIKYLSNWTSSWSSCRQTAEYCHVGEE